MQEKYIVFTGCMFFADTTQGGGMEFVSAFTLHAALLPHEYKQLKVCFTGLEPASGMSVEKNSRNVPYFIPKDVFFVSKASINCAHRLREYLATHSIQDIVGYFQSTAIVCEESTNFTENMTNIMQLCTGDIYADVTHPSVDNTRVAPLFAEKETAINKNRMMLILAFLLEESLHAMQCLHKDVQKQYEDFFAILHDMKQEMHDTLPVLSTHECSIDSLAILKALAFFANSDTILVSTNENLFAFLEEHGYITLMPESIRGELESMHLVQYVRGYIPSVGIVATSEDYAQETHTAVPVLFFERR